jgi:hypothetical protein
VVRVAGFCRIRGCRGRFEVVLITCGEMVGVLVAVQDWRRRHDCRVRQCRRCGSPGAISNEPMARSGVPKARSGDPMEVVLGELHGSLSGSTTAVGQPPSGGGQGAYRASTAGPTSTSCAGWSTGASHGVALVRLEDTVGRPWSG